MLPSVHAAHPAARGLTRTALIADEFNVNNDEKDSKLDVPVFIGKFDAALPALASLCYMMIVLIRALYFLCRCLARFGASGA